MDRMSNPRKRSRRVSLTDIDSFVDLVKVDGIERDTKRTRDGPVVVNAGISTAPSVDISYENIAHTSGNVYYLSDTSSSSSQSLDIFIPHVRESNPITMTSTATPAAVLKGNLHTISPIPSLCNIDSFNQSLVTPAVPQARKSTVVATEGMLESHEITVLSTLRQPTAVQDFHKAKDVVPIPKSRSLILFVSIFLVVAACCGRPVGVFRIPWRSNTLSNSVCVSGGGFSGFWYTLGRLESITERSNKQYYCYSAGCLGVVASLREFSMEQMYDMAFAIQKRWKNGEISRYEVVAAFVDDLLLETSDTCVIGGTNRTRARLDNNDLSRLNIITTVPNGRFGLRPSIRTPTSIESLRAMLIQTAWIPFAIGDDLWYHDHMDGAFSVLHHPSCEHYVGLSLDWDLYMNVVNVNLGRSKVEKFWNKGLARGL